MNSMELGPFAYENWKLLKRGEPLQAVYEYPLFTDAHIIGEVRDNYGPYQLLNTVPTPPDSGLLAPTIVLRVDSYVDPDDRMGMESTNTERFHGGMLGDEIAGLVSLSLGARVKAGGATRYFAPEDDPKGKPINWFSYQNPVLIDAAPQKAILPGALGPHDLEKTHLLGYLTDITESNAIALVRAARLYQDAIWIIESDPALSWLLFVSSIEIAAGCWFQSDFDELEALNEAYPGLAQILEDAGGQEVAWEVAREFAPYLRSSKKFREFVISFLPNPPSDRPQEHFQVPWKTRAMKKALVQIYHYRSRALHDGIPFPQPMCMPAGMKEEKPLGLATSSSGGVWLAKDMPMLLHVFEYLVRNSLLKWWKSMLSDEK